MNDQMTAAIFGNVGAALQEDLGSGDKTAQLVPESTTASAIIICREPMTLAGQPWVDEVFRQLDPDVDIQWLANDGDHLPADAEICVLDGAARSLLSGERTALNFLQTLSATATMTSRYVNAVANFKARILDTRKTIPGLRIAQKYAVRCGGGNNHRIGLFDAILIKENHIVSAGGVEAAIRTAKEQHSNLPIEIEVESVTELRDALRAGADRLLLDNFDIADLQRAVEVNHKEGDPPVDLEASGGLTLDEIVKVAETGVDYISVGALTKNITAIDLSMRFRYDT
ncbi:MAG: carboxylating nicotinate-nucleotide diphosphorylase [Proteobacteria bacterium]|nr:carboxylating nicotinate-nucleotide diphosphorylase [Pseudomonadota bacterium]